MLDAVVALFAYEGVGAKLVTALKYGNHRDALRPLAGSLAAVAAAAADLVGPVDRVTWVPTTRARSARRGFDQGELIAAVVASRLRVPCARLLDRPSGPRQVDGDRAARARIELRARRPTAGRILVVDDVRTTGASLRAAARSLRGAGATSVLGATLAARP